MFDGSFYGFRPLSGDALKTEVLTVGDVDRDGSLDVVAGFHVDLSMGESPEPVRVYFNDGEGFFGPGDLLGDTPYSTLGLALGDMDGDGWLDVIESSDYDPIADVVSPMRVRLGVGDGAFGGAQVQPGSPVFGYDLTVADLNGDGALDVLSAGGNDLSLGNGDGTLAEGAFCAGCGLCQCAGGGGSGRRWGRRCGAGATTTSPTKST